jgi:hypothetical protein
MQEKPQKTTLELGKEQAMKSREYDLKEMEKLLEDHLASREYVDSYANQKAKALDAMSKYVNYSYDLLDLAMEKTDNTPRERERWEDFLTECERDVNQYRTLIAAFLTEAAGRKQKKEEQGEKMNLDDLFYLTERGNEIFVQMAENRHYGDIMRKILLKSGDEMLPEEYDFILAGFQPRNPGPLTREDSLKLMEESGIVSIMAAMDGRKRMEFMRYIISKKKEKALALITSFASGKYLTVEQAKILLGEMQLDAASVEETLKTVEEGQKRTEEEMANIHDALQARMDTNAAVKFFQPKYLAGTALILWRGTNLLLAGVAHRKNLTELLHSPWFYADVAGIIAGNALLGNPTMWEWITKDTGSADREIITARTHLAQQMMNAPDISKMYFEKDGVVEAIAFVREKNKKAGKGNTATLKEVLEAINDPANGEKQFVKKLSQPARENLQFAATRGDEKKVDQFIKWIAAVPYYEKTDSYRRHVKELREMQGVTEKEEASKEALGSASEK